MIAVIDDDAERRIEIGPAAAASERRSLMHDDLTLGIEKAHGGAQAGDARADNMDHAGRSQDAISQKRAEQAQPARLDAPPRRREALFQHPVEDRTISGRHQSRRLHRRSRRCRHE